MSRPRLGFLGVGWIGRNRLASVVRSDAAEIVALADPNAAELDEAAALAPRASLVGSLGQLLKQDLDGVVIATPSALHARQAVEALERGVAVFCQKPLARTAAEAQIVLDAARRADRLVSVDFSYRNTAGLREIHRLVRGGEIGDVFAADLIFHNAYGPDKPWFRDRALSGGGCLVDLGTHLIDAALWLMDFPVVQRAQGRLWAAGVPLTGTAQGVEDYAIAQLDLAGGAAVRIACSWNLSAGQDAVIDWRFHGTRAGLTFRNVDGSFYDFVAERHDGTHCTRLSGPRDDWGGRTIDAWVARLAASRAFDPTLQQAVTVAQVIDSIYGV